ncbi:MAG: GNAT family N-acetyltransferase [Candidatus Kariarchaeaceae archaeon]
MYFGEIVKLRQLEMDDLPSIMKYWNTWENRRTTDMILPRSELTEREWLERACKAHPWRDGFVFFAIEEKYTEEFLGTVSLQKINPTYRNADFGIIIHNPANFGKGYGTDATKVILWFAFHLLGLQSVMLNVFEMNLRGIRAYEKAGFKHVGKLRQAAFVEGKWCDVVLMDILKDEFFDEFPPGTYNVSTLSDEDTLIEEELESIEH